MKRYSYLFEISKPSGNNRNNLEHFDEKIDSWVAESKRHNILDKCVMRNGGVIGLNKQDYFRWLDPFTQTFYFRTQPCNLEEINRYIIALDEKLLEIKRKIY